jgi:hypothetical protein
MVWLIASLIGLFSIFLVISIPSIFLLFKMGTKKYFKVISFLYKEYRNIENVYRINKKLHYIDQYGNSFTRSDIYYYCTTISEIKVNVICCKTLADTLKTTVQQRRLTIWTAKRKEKDLKTVNLLDLKF